MAFGDAFGMIARNNPPIDSVPEDGAETFVDFPNYMGGIIFIYRMTLVDFDTGKFGTQNNILCIILWLMCTLFNLIIMLNLLISIISESYEKISENIDAAAQQERASMVAENQFLIPTSRKKNFCPSNKYLVVALDTSEVEQGQQLDPASAVESLKKTVIGRIEQTDKKLEKVEDDLRAMRADFKRELNSLFGDPEAPNPTQQKIAASVKNLFASKIGTLSPSSKPEELTGDINEQMRKLNDQFRDILKAQTRLAAEIRAKK